MNRSELFQQVPRILRSAFGLLLGAALLVACVTLASTSAAAQFAGPTQLNLVNGWTNAPFGTSNAMVEESNGIVQFRGAIGHGTSATAFTLPVALAPRPLCTSRSTSATQPRDALSFQAVVSSVSRPRLCSAMPSASRRLTVRSSPLLVHRPYAGQRLDWRSVRHQCSGDSGHRRGSPLQGRHVHNWHQSSGIHRAHFGSPENDVYIPVDLCNATNGRLHITPAGVVDVEAEGGTFSNAQCFTSLDGAWYGPTTTGYSALALINGWTNGPFSTSIAAAANAWGSVYFKGAIATTGTNAQPFTLGPRFRPITNVYVNVDLCNATKGRLFIQTSGVVTVQAETSLQQCTVLHVARRRFVRPVTTSASRGARTDPEEYGSPRPKKHWECATRQRCAKLTTKSLDG